MTTLEFRPNGHLTLGVEVEVQLINKNSYDLYPMAVEVLKQLSQYPKIIPEIFQSMLEVKTGICTNVHDVKEDLRESFLALNKICETLEIDCATTGTHPFAKYNERILYPSERYFQLIDRNQWIARRLSIFGLHVHLGMKSNEECIFFMNFFQHFLPHFVSLSASSPFWQGENTGLASSRLSVFEASPTSGHIHSIKNWTEFELLYDSLRSCNAIQSAKDLWWDIRPSPGYGTLEIRICDGLATFHELLGVVALIHALAHHIDGLPADERGQALFTKTLPLWVIRENKWRAIRHGLDAEVIRNCEGETRPIRDDVRQLMELIQPTILDLGYQDYMQYVEMILLRGNSSARQLRTFEASSSCESIVKMTSSEFKRSYIQDIMCM